MFISCIGFDLRYMSLKACTSFASLAIFRKHFLHIFPGRIFTVYGKVRIRNLESGIWNLESGHGTGTGTAIGVNCETLKAVLRGNLSRYIIQRHVLSAFEILS